MCSRQLAGIAPTYVAWHLLLPLLHGPCLPPSWPVRLGGANVVLEEVGVSTKFKDLDEEETVTEEEVTTGTAVGVLRALLPTGLRALTAGWVLRAPVPTELRASTAGILTELRALTVNGVLRALSAGRRLRPWAATCARMSPASPSPY